MQEKHREQRSAQWIENFLRDFRFGLSSLLRTPSFTAIVVGVLALGIGANVAMFSLVDAVLLKPLPFREPDRIVAVWEAPRKGVTNATSTPDFLDWKRLGTRFEALAATQHLSSSLTGNGEAMRLNGMAVTTDYFRIFQVGPGLGRSFSAADDQPVVVLSHAAWQKYFAGDPGILGRKLILDGEAYPVIGVLPPGAFDREEVAFWKPLVFAPEQQRRDFHWMTVYGRLRAGVTPAQAQEQLQAIATAQKELTPLFKRDWKIQVEAYENLVVGDGLRRQLYIAFGAVAFVLLIACANVANLLIGKGVARRKELAVRAALGASRGRLIAQLLTESLALCLLGGAAGVLLAWLLLRLAQPFLLQALPFTAAVNLDLRVLAFAVLLALGVALLVGVLPSLQTSFANLAASMNATARGSSGSHSFARRLIVIAEVALSLVLLCGAMLLFRSLLKLQDLDTGVRIDKVMTMSIDVPLRAYPTPQRAALLYESLAQRVKAAPGVSEVALATHLPLRWIGNGEGMMVPGVEKPVNVRFKRVDPGYFRSFGIPLLSGREITERDRNNTPRIAVINEALAQRLREVAQGKDPVGMKVQVSCPNYEVKGTTIQDIEIAGVIRSERVGGPGRPDPPVVYVPLAQSPSGGVRLIVRTQGEPSVVVPGLREALREVDPSLAPGDLATMQEVREQTLSGSSRPAWLIGCFALVAALLAALGLYGVLSNAVMQQRREIGIRMALGARGIDVVLQVLQNAVVTVAAGLLLGLAGAFSLTRVMKNLLYETSPMDPLAFSFACALMMAVGIAAGFVPANRASRVDPVTSLREDA